MNVVPSPTSLSTAMVPPSCSTIFREMASPSQRPRRFVVLKSSKITASRSLGIPRPVSLILIRTRSPVSSVTTAIAPPGDVASIALTMRLRYTRPNANTSPSTNNRVWAQLSVQGEAGRFCQQLHRVECLLDRSIDINREPLEWHGTGKIAQVLQHPLDRREFSVDRSTKRVAILRVASKPQDKLATVADVLDRVRDVVHETGGDPTEHRLAFLFPYVILKLDELGGHPVERIT